MTINPKVISTKSSYSTTNNPISPPASDHCPPNTLVAIRPQWLDLLSTRLWGLLRIQLGEKGNVEKGKVKWWKGKQWWRSMCVHSRVHRLHMNCLLVVILEKKMKIANSFILPCQQLYSDKHWRHTMNRQYESQSSKVEKKEEGILNEIAKSLETQTLECLLFAIEWIVGCSLDEENAALSLLRHHHQSPS